MVRIMATRKVTQKRTAATPFLPGRDLYNRVRGGLISQGTTLQAWCEANGVEHYNARHALFGTSMSESAQKIRARLIEAAGLREQAA